MVESSVQFDKRVKREMSEFITKHYGHRCKVFSFGCPNCMAWGYYDYYFNFAREIKWETRKVHKASHFV